MPPDFMRAPASSRWGSPVATRPQVQCKTRVPPSVFLIKQQIKPPKCLLNICTPGPCALRGTFSAAWQRGPSTPGWQRAGLKAGNSLCPPRPSPCGLGPGKGPPVLSPTQKRRGAPSPHWEKAPRASSDLGGSPAESKCSHLAEAPSRSGGIHRESEDRGPGGSSLGPGGG